MTELFITVPLTPPSVNAYVRHTRKGRHYVSAEAKAYKLAVAVCASGVGEISKGDYEVSVGLYLGKGERLDADNSLKVVLDSLVDAGVIHSDAAITDLHVSKRRDRSNPRTEITIREGRSM